ncbi:MAG: hypothetical protein H0W87_08345 [Actinobacteria bacterium]|nr:hypothetical protein [Actinomycetota bacterium]
MTATIERESLARSDPSATAQELARLNSRLARDATISEDIAEAVHLVVAGIVDPAASALWEVMDPYLAFIVHRAALQAGEALRDRDDQAARDRLRVTLETLRQGFAAIAENEPVADERSSKEVARWLADTAEVPQTSLAELLGVSLRQFQRWISPHTKGEPEGDDARRLRTVARIVNQLRFSLTPSGAVDWFTWPRDDLGGQRPIELLDDLGRLPELIAIAGGMRSTYLA